MTFFSVFLLLDSVVNAIFSGFPTDCILEAALKLG